MLTDIQAKKLLSRDRYDPTERAKYDYIIAKKLKTALDNLGDIDVILNRLPEHKVKKVITDKHISILLKATETMMRKMDYRKVRSIDDENLIVFQEDNDRKLQSILPTKRDLQRAKRLYEHLYELEAFVDPTLLDRVPLPDYERPKHYPGGIGDTHENFLRLQAEEKKYKKIKDLLASGMVDIEQIAKETGCTYSFVEDVIESQRRKKEQQEEIAKLEQDSSAIQVIKDLWADGLYNKSEIAKTIGYTRDSVIAVTERMMRDKVIPPDLVVVPGGGFPKPSEIDLAKHEEIARAMQPLMSKRDETK